MHLSQRGDSGRNEKCPKMMCADFLPKVRGMGRYKPILIPLQGKKGSRFPTSDFKHFDSVYCKMEIFELSFWHPQAGFKKTKDIAVQGYLRLSFKEWQYWYWLRTLCLCRLDILHENMVCSTEHCLGQSDTLCPTIWSHWVSLDTWLWG